MTGFKFTAGDTDALASALRRAVDRHTDPTLRVQARAAYEQRYSAEANYGALMAAYARAAHHRAAR